MPIVEIKQNALRWERRKRIRNLIGVPADHGIYRAGVVPLIMELNNIFEAVEGPGAYFLLGNLLGEAPERASRYQSRNAGAVIAGPTAGLIGDFRNLLQGTLRGLSDGEPGVLSGFDDGTAGSIDRVLPFGNHPGIKQFLNLWAIPALKGEL